MRKQFAVTLLATVALACSSENTAGPSSFTPGSPLSDFMAIPADLIEWLQGGEMSRAQPLTIQTYNLYIGTDVDRVIASPPDEFDQRVQEALATFISTDFGSRSGAIANQILDANAHVVGLQEVYLINTQGVAGVPDMSVDFLGILQAQLAARGLDYRVVAQETLTQLIIPAGGGTVSLVDSDVLLVRGDVSSTNPSAVVYQAKLTVPFGPSTLDILRGYTAADVDVGGKRYRIVNTHFEPRQPAPQIQQAQAVELLSALADVEDPVVVLGDLNSGPADSEASSPYNMLVESGFADSWASRVPGQGSHNAQGFTCCQASDLRNGASQLVERIDLIMIRNDFGFLPRSVIGSAVLEVVGADQDDRTSSGLWPSDHASVVGTFRLPTMTGLVRKQ